MQNDTILISDGDESLQGSKMYLYTKFDYSTSDHAHVKIQISSFRT